MKIKRQECIDWLNANYPIIINGNKIDWKYAKSGCWFCPFWKKEKLLQLTDWQKQEMIKLEEQATIFWKVKVPFKQYLNMDKHSLDEYNEESMCSSGHCFV